MALDSIDKSIKNKNAYSKSNKYNNIDFNKKLFIKTTTKHVPHNDDNDIDFENINLFS